MKCSEAVEWMHRYIDRDLSEEESSVLFEHMRGCRDCSEQFALLNELSAKLDKLPKVTPRFSLVDSILPQLDEIDRARREGGSTAEEIPGTMVAVDSRDETGHRSHRPGRTTRRTRVYRTGAFGLAAALILGVFINQYEPRTLSDAEMTSLAVSQDKNSSTANDSAVQKSATDSSGNTQAETDKPAAEGDINFPEKSNRSGDNADTADSGVAQDSKAPDETAQTSNKPEAASPVNPSTEAGNTGKAGNQNFSAKSDQSNIEVPATKEPAANSKGSAGTGNKDQSAIQDDPESRTADPLPEMSMFGINSFSLPTMNQWPSPDGLFTAELSDGHLYVYRNTMEEPNLLVDKTLDGNWVSGEWSLDGKSFTYVTEKDGVSSTSTVLPVKSGETEANADQGASTGNNSSANKP